MIILILGNNHSASSFYNLFSKSKENIVFSTIRNYPNFIDFETDSDIIDFIEANSVNFVLMTENKYIDSNLSEEISNLTTSVFAPSKEANAICASKTCAKKFMYKNKFSTPKFQIIEKPQLALDYFKNSSTPQAIKPDNHTFREGVKFAETFNEAQRIIDNLFKSGNKKVIIEDYIEGKNVSFWVLTDGYNAKTIGLSAKYQDEIAYFNPSFVDKNLKRKIEEEFILPTINVLNSQGEEYIGVLGFDFIITPKNRVYLINYNNFFDDINVDFFTKGFDVNWLDVFERVLVGDVFVKYDDDNFAPHSNFMMILRDEKINFICAKTKTNLKLYLNELDYNLSLVSEAKKSWKF